jgi:hypothetical protein
VLTANPAVSTSDELPRPPQLDGLVLVDQGYTHPAAPQDRQWMWTFAYGCHEDRTLTHGYEPTREAAMAAFAKSWRMGRAVMTE